MKYRIFNDYLEFDEAMSEFEEEEESEDGDYEE